MFKMRNSLDAYHFSLFRAYLGGYLFVIFASSFFHSSDIWSREGIVPNTSLNLSYGVFPNVLAYFDSPLQIKLFLIFLSIASLLLILGIQRTIVALVLWYGWTCLLNRNNLTINPSIHFIGWLLIASAIIPHGEKWSISKSKEEWEIPQLILVGAWIIFALGYAFSGVDKCFSASWVDGSAIKKILEGPLGYPTSSMLINLLPDFFLKLCSWTVILMELLCLPLSIFARTRKWAWTLATMLQLGILFTINIAPIVFGMFTFHLFLFDPQWFSIDKRVVKIVRLNQT